MAVSQAAPQTEPKAAKAGQAAAATASQAAPSGAAQGAALQTEVEGLVEQMKAAGEAQAVVLLQQALDAGPQALPSARHVPADMDHQHHQQQRQHARAHTGNDMMFEPVVAKPGASAWQAPAAVHPTSQHIQRTAPQHVQQADTVQQGPQAAAASDRPDEKPARLAVGRAAGASQHHLAAAWTPAPSDLAAAAGAAAAHAARASMLAQPEQLPSALMWTMQHWLLVVQLSVMAGALVVLAACSRHRRPGSQRPLPLFSPPAPQVLPKS